MRQGSIFKCKIELRKIVAQEKCNVQQRWERDLARRWASGEFLGVPLCTTTGERLTILYTGRPGGGAGPDFRDAVIRLGDGQTLCGDVELHLRGGFWRAHGHQDDPRYQRVILHVVLENDLRPTRLPDGEITPVLALADVVAPPTLPLRAPARWPCQEEATRLTTPELLALLDDAGRARFLEKAGAFRQALEAHLGANWEAPNMEQPLSANGSGWSAESKMLFVALAEGMGFGREHRAAFRLLGERLVAALAGSEKLPPAELQEVIERNLPAIKGVERERSEALIAWAIRWRAGGPWPALYPLLVLPVLDEAQQALVAALTIEHERPKRSQSKSAPAAGSSAGRAAILVWNVVLPFASAWAGWRGEAALAERALALAVEFPGLPSNQITRSMKEQLLLPAHPKMALAQQGLQHIHRAWCQQKICAACPCAKATPMEDRSTEQTPEA